MRAVERTDEMPRHPSAVAEGPTRVVLSWLAPAAADAAAITGYGIQFSDDGGAHWAMLPSVDRRITSFVHTVGLRPNASLLYRVFSISEEGAGPAAVVSAATPALAMPRIVDVKVTTDEGTTRWYPPRRNIVVTVRFDQAVSVHTELGTPRVILTLGRPPHRQSGYASDYSGGSGTDRLTFRYPADWSQDLRDVEIGPDALHRSGARITNVHASHGASLAHGPATLRELDQVDPRSDTVLVMGTHPPTPAPASPDPDLRIAEIARYDSSGSSGVAAMLTAAGALVARTELSRQLELAARDETARQVELADGRGELERTSDSTSGAGRDSSLAEVAVGLGNGVGRRAAANAPRALRLSSYGLTQTRVTLFWYGIGQGGDPDDYLIEYSDDAGTTWVNLLGYDDQDNDVYRPASEGRQYEDTGIAPGTSRSYRVTARNSGGVRTSNELSITTKQMVAVPACAGAVWSTEISVGTHQNGSEGFTKDAGTSSNFGSVNDADFAFRGATHVLVQAYFIKDRPGYNVGFAHGPDEEDGWDGLTFHIGGVALPLADAYAATRQQSTVHSQYRAYAWKGSQYSGTFDYELDDWVKVCLVDDRPQVTLTLTPDSISEDGASSTVTATVPTASDTPFTVTVSAAPDSPAVDADFSLSTNRILSFAANATESTGTVTITAVNNSVDTPDKTLQVKGELSSGTDLRAPGDVALTITDDDAAPELTLSVSPATIAEDGGEATVTVSTAGSTFAAQQVITLTLAGTATKGTDYSVAAETLTLAMGERSVSTTITAIDDAADESDEAILVTAAHDGGTVGSEQRITIADTLSATVSGPSDGVNEGDDAEFTVTLAGGTSTADVEVNYSVDGDSTATSGADYTAPSGKLTITAGASSGTITIETRTDQVLDPGETVVVVLSSATTTTRTVNVDGTAKVSATIVEQGMETVSVGPVLVADDDQTPEDETDDKSSVAEGETASFVVTLSGEVSGTVNVTYTTANGTAEAGAGKDYTTASGTLQFTTGQTGKTVEVTTLEDTRNEADETYTLTLTGVTGVSGVSLGTASATGTIEDDDPLTAALGTHTANVAEGSDATFEVDLSGGTSTAAVEVSYAVDASSTAASGADYTAPSGTLTIAAGDSSGTITIETLTDQVLDPGETLVVKLTSATTGTRTVTVDATATKTTTIGDSGMETVSVGPVLVADNDQTPEDETDDRSSVEEGETASFVVTLSGAVSGTVNVTYTTANGTAEAGAGKDYTTASGTLQFTTGQTGKTVEVTTLEDTRNEADETYTLTLTNVTGVSGVSLGTASATGTIEDDDPLTAALGTHTANVAEGSDATFEVDLSGGTSTAAVEVSYAVDASSTATPEDDYTAPSGTLTIAAGDSSGTITIETLTDQVLDPGETLVVKLTSATTDTRTVTVDQTATKTTTIGDSGMETVSVGPVLVEDNDQTPEDETDDRSSVEEGETASFVVTLSGEVSGTVIVTYTTADGTAEAGAGKDYTTASGTLQFTTGQTSKTVEVTTLEDTRNEADETYTLTLTNVTGVSGVSLGTASATGTIEDDDPLTAALGTHTANVAEGSDATFEVDLSGGTSTAAVEVSYAVDASSTATPEDDYTAPSGTLTIAAGDSSGTITIETLTDQVLDPGETLVLKLTSATTDARTVTVDATATKTTTIGDSGMETVSVGPVLVEDNDQTPEDETDDRSSVEEGETASFVVTLSGEVSGTVNVTYTTADGTAEAGAGKDYTTASGTLQFTTGETGKTVEVTTLEDTLNEADETYTLTLTNVTGVSGVSLGTASATGTIEDDDALTAALGTHTEEPTEGAAATFAVDLSGGTSTAEVEVNYAVDEDSTATSGTDYTAPSGILTITAGASSGTITIETRTDAVVDPGETVVLKLTSATTAARPVTVDDSVEKTATIKDSNSVTVSLKGFTPPKQNSLTPNLDGVENAQGRALVRSGGLRKSSESEQEQSTTSVEEGETARFIVELSGLVASMVTVTYGTTDGTADSTGSDPDYTAANGTLKFGAGDTIKTIEVATLEDLLNEPDETFTVTLTGLTGPDGVNMGTATGTGTIEDDDPLTAALGTHTENVAEGSAATFEVDLSGGTSTADVEVRYAVHGDSTATSGTDYTAPSGTLTIAAGESSGAITIETKPDEVLDPGETVVVVLSSATTAARTVTVDGTVKKTATIAEQGTATVSVDAVLVEDDDQTPHVDESDDKSRVAESETASFVVTLSRTVSGTVSVDYTTADGTAESGTGKDYTTASATLQFSTGDLSKTIEVTTLDDSLNEPDETFTVTLSGLSAPTGVSLGKTTATGTIEDDDQLTAALGTHTEHVAEGDAATFEVDLTGGTSTADVEVNYAVDTSSTAILGTDYTAPSWKLTIAAGESSGTITITTRRDHVVEPDETVVLKLTSATTAARPVTVDDTAKKTATVTDATANVRPGSGTTAAAPPAAAPDAPPGVTVSPVALELRKGGSSKSYTLSLQSEPEGEVTIDIDGPGAGVQVSRTRVIFTPQTWSSPQTVAVSATENAREGTTVSITHTVSGANYDGLPASPVTVTIQEEAGVTLGLEPRSNTGTQGGGATAADKTRIEGETARFFVQRTTTSAPELAIGVTVTQEGDYLAGPVPAMVRLMPGENRKYIDIHLEDDAIPEPDGSISVTIACDCTVVDGTMKVNVLNNDAEFAVADAEAVESAGQISFTVRKASALGVAMELLYETVDGTAAAGKDYEQPAEGARVTILPHQERVTLTIPVTDDALVEDDESFRLRVYHPRDADVDDTATGTIVDDDSAVAKAWLSRFGRTVASHVVEAVDARLTGELGPVTQVTLGGTMLPSDPPPVQPVQPLQPDAVAAMPHTSMDAGAFLAGSSFQVLAAGAGLDGAVGTGLTMWGRGAATGLQGEDETVSLTDGQVGTGTVGVDYDWGGILAGLAVAYSGGGADYRLTGGAARSDRAASWLISAHPYARAQIVGDRLTAWGLLGYGLGRMTLAEDAQDEDSGISLIMGAMGLRGVLSPETNRLGLSVKSDAFMTSLTAGEDAAVQTGAHRARLLAEGTYRIDVGAGGLLVPRLVTGVRYDFGDVETGFGAEMGGGVTYTYPDWGLTAAANVRVLLTHEDSGFEEWGGGGSLRVTPGAAGRGPTVAVNTSLGVPASGAQRLWTSGVVLRPAPSAATAPGANIDAEMGYGLAVADGGGMLTPYVGMAVSEKGARAFRLGSRLSIGPSFSLSVQGERREATAGDATHGVSVSGALGW